MMFFLYLVKANYRQPLKTMKTEYTVLRAQNLRGREVSDIRNGARMVSEIPERSTEP